MSAGQGQGGVQDAREAGCGVELPRRELLGATMI